MQNFAGIVYWISPLSVFMMSIYIIAFSRESFPALILISILSLHPIVAIPIAIFVDSLQEIAIRLVDLYGYFRYFNLQTAIQRFLKRLFTFTMTTYLGCLTLVQWYLFLAWIDKREVLIRNGYESIKTMNQFKDEPFNQCPCPDDICNFTKDTTNEILNVMSEIYQYDKVLTLLGSSGFFFVFHFIESLVVSEPYSKPLLNFLTGRPVDDAEETTEVVQEEIEMNQISQSQQNALETDDISHERSDNVAEDVDLFHSEDQFVVGSVNRQSLEASADQESFQSLLESCNPMEHNDNPSEEQNSSTSLGEMEEKQRTSKIVCMKPFKCSKVIPNTLAIIYIVFVACCPLTFDFFMDNELKHNGNSKFLQFNMNMIKYLI